jgi:hypothetical protein
MAICVSLVLRLIVALRIDKSPKIKIPAVLGSGYQKVANIIITITAVIASMYDDDFWYLRSFFIQSIF